MNIQNFTFKIFDKILWYNFHKARQIKSILLFLSSRRILFSDINLFFRLNTFFFILNIFPNTKPFALKLLEIIKSIEIGDFLVLENFIRFFKLLPLPEIKTAVLIFLDPVNVAF